MTSPSQTIRLSIAAQAALHRGDHSVLPKGAAAPLDPPLLGADMAEASISPPVPPRAATGNVVGADEGESSPIVSDHISQPRGVRGVATPRPSETSSLPSPPLSAYIPYSPTGDLGGEMNRIMARLDPDEWALFLDHDVLILTSELWVQLRQAIKQHPDAGAITCWTNRAGNVRQKAKAPKGDDIADHLAYAQLALAWRKPLVTNITSDRLTGFLFATSKRAWDLAGPFQSGFGGVDNAYAAALRRHGLRTYRLNHIYVYHQRMTNGWRGATPSRTNCQKTAWLWQQAAPIIQQHAPQALRDLVAQHQKLIEARPDWTDCQKNARRRARLAEWRAQMTISVVIPSREEEPDELRATIASWRTAGAGQIIVIDDGSTVPIPADCGADLLLRNDYSQGVAASRNQGLARAAGNVIAFSDSHCRVLGPLGDWAFQAHCSNDILCAVCQSADEPDHNYWGTKLAWKQWKYDVSANQTFTPTPQGLFGSVYAAARWTWDAIGNWPPTQGWGYNEQALSLACHLTRTPIRVLPWFTATHRFRNNRKFPYSASLWTSQANAILTHWLIFSPDYFNTVLLPLAEQHAPHQALDRFHAWIHDLPELTTARHDYAARAQATDTDILTALGGPAMPPAPKGDQSPLETPLQGADSAEAANSAPVATGETPDPDIAAPAIGNAPGDRGGETVATESGRIFQPRGSQGDASPWPSETSSSSQETP